MGAVSEGLIILAAGRTDWWPLLRHFNIWGSTQHDEVLDEKNSKLSFQDGHFEEFRYLVGGLFSDA